MTEDIRRGAMPRPAHICSVKYSEAYRRNGSAVLIRSRFQRALRAHIKRVDRCAAADEQTVPERAAKDQVGARLRQVDLAEQIPRGTVAAHPVFLRVGPAHAAPHVAIYIAAHSIG